MAPPQKIVIVGAGPVGSLAALYAAQRNYEVELYELRPGQSQCMVSVAYSPVCQLYSTQLHPLSFIGRGAGATTAQINTSQSTRNPRAIVSRC